MDSKPWYLSKSIWGGVAALALAAYGYLSGDIESVQAIILAILGWMGISLRTAID